MAKQTSKVSQCVGHNPHDPRVQVIEDLAMVMCSACSDDELRWRNPECDSEWVHHDDVSPYEGQECEASAMLTAAMTLGIPLYTGADLEFAEPETVNE